MIQILQEAALKGGEILRSYFKKNVEMSYKTNHQNLVTKADIESQKVIKDFLEKEMIKKHSINSSEIGFIGEENLYKPGKYLFAIDPLDGTSNFASGFEYFAVSIGLFIDGNLQYGVIYEPIQEKLYIAEKSKGAMKKNKDGKQKLHIELGNLKNLCFSGGLSVYEELRKKQLAMYNALFPHFRGFLSLQAGCSSMCLLAENTFGLYFMGGPWIWDLAAGHLIIEEAGGIVVDWNGKKFPYDLANVNKRYPFMACHPKNLSVILEFMK